MFSSWNGRRAIDYRRQNKISDDLGTAVNVQSMVFGNRGDDSGTGVAFTRDPSTGEQVPYGDYLVNAQGEDVVAGIRNTLPLAELEQVDPDSYAKLREVMHTLEQHYRDMCDIEFTIEQGRLWILQTRVGKRTAFGEWVMAHDMLDEGLIDEGEALLRVDANRLEELFKRRVDATGATPIATGLNASPGAATGTVVFTADEAQARGRAGERVILVRRETTPDDYHGMIAAQGILTSAGRHELPRRRRRAGRGHPGGLRRRRDQAARGRRALRRRRHDRARGRHDHDRRLHRQRLPRRAAAAGVRSWRRVGRATSRPGRRRCGVRSTG